MVRIEESESREKAYGGSGVEINGRVSEGTLYIFLSGELDEHGAREARERADEIIERNISCTKVIFDLTGVRFMDSAGIGFLIGRYKRLHKYRTPAYIQSPDFAADKILAMSGIYALIPKL